MKKFLLLSACIVTYLFSFAQQDTLIPKWKTGDIWKVTYQTCEPAEPKDPAMADRYDTTTTTLAWEVKAILEDKVKMSVRLLDFSFKASQDMDMDDFVQGVLRLKEAQAELLYYCHPNGSLNWNNQPKTFLDEGEFFFINHEVFGALFPAEEAEEDFEEEYGEEVTSPVSLYGTSINAFLVKIIERLHSPYGEPIITGREIDIKEYPKEKWESYMKGLSSMMEMMNIEGSTAFTILNDTIDNSFHLKLDMSSFLKTMAQGFTKDAKKKEKKKLDTEFDKFSMFINQSGHLYLDKTSHFPLFYKIDTRSEMSEGGKKVIIRAFEHIVFE